MNWEKLLKKKGELIRAENLFLESLTIREHQEPISPYTALNLAILGSLFYSLGDANKAEQYIQRSLTIANRIDTDSRVEVLKSFLVYVVSFYSYMRGEYAEMESIYEQIATLLEKLESNSIFVAHVYAFFSLTAWLRGDLINAENFYEKTITVFEENDTDSLDSAFPLAILGLLTAARGDLDKSEKFLIRSFKIQENISPNSIRMAYTLLFLSIVARERKDYPQAQQYLARAIAIYETQRSAVRDPETRTLFGEQYLNAYTLQAQIALDQNRPEQAALALERSRARSLGELLHARVLSLPDEAPQALKDLMAQQEKLQREHLLLAREQRKANANDAETARRLRAKSHELAERQRQIDQQLREKFPRYASLLNPKPPTLKQIQNSLDANTVLLYHAFADKELLIIAVSRQAVQSYRVKVDVRALEKDLIEFQRLVAKPPLERTADERASVTQLGRRLYARLIKPAEASLKQARTVLLCPEGALNRLPWGALVVTVDKQGRPTYWIERVAIGVTLSADVYLQARAVRPAQRGVAIAAVSQYRNPQGLQDASVATLTRRSGSALKNLPSVKQETARLKQALNNLGVVVAQEDDATPQKVRQMAQNARVVHFACHARADHVDPLGSGLLLSPAGSDAGLLTAAEIVSRWQLRADVVMLSACETAVGRLHQYEGMYGLARAFLFAGARSVGASLWQVSDASTARLMEAFYREYARGIPKVEALRRAQVALLRDRQYADPYYWSCFVLMGAER
jgi:CHAT domain-containing protein/tetratricopeptide (TPR) repeat protein